MPYKKKKFFCFNIVLLVIILLYLPISISNNDICITTLLWYRLRKLQYCCAYKSIRFHHTDVETNIQLYVYSYAGTLHYFKIWVCVAGSINSVLLVGTAIVCWILYINILYRSRELKFLSDELKTDFGTKINLSYCLF